MESLGTLSSSVHDADCFIGLHDRKVWIGFCLSSYLYSHFLVVCALGLVHLMQMPDNQSVTGQAQQLVPSALLLFDGLKRANAAWNDDESSEEGDCDEEGIDSILLDSDEDEIDDEVQAYLENLQVGSYELVGRLISLVMGHIL